MMDSLHIGFYDFYKFVFQIQVYYLQIAQFSTSQILLKYFICSLNNGSLYWKDINGAENLVNYFKI